MVEKIFRLREQNQKKKKGNLTEFVRFSQVITHISTQLYSIEIYTPIQAIFRSIQPFNWNSSTLAFVERINRFLNITSTIQYKLCTYKLNEKKKSMCLCRSYVAHPKTNNIHYTPIETTVEKDFGCIQLPQMSWWQKKKTNRWCFAWI